MLKHPSLVFSLLLILFDSDGVEGNGSQIINMPAPENFTVAGSTDLYFGRIVVENAYGPETAPLPMWAHTQYCTTITSDGNPIDAGYLFNVDRFEQER